MKVGELVELLSDFDEELEVRTMSQPGWPFEYRIQGLWSGDATDEEDEWAKAVYIVEGTQLGYGTKRAWEACSNA